MAWRDGEGSIIFVFCTDGRVVNKKERDAGWRWEQYGGYMWIWEISSTTCLIRFKSPCISVITHGIRTRNCHICDHKLTSTRNSLKFQLFMMLSSISSHCSPSCPQLYHHQTSQSWVNPLSPCHDHELTLSTAYTKYYIIPWLTVSHSQQVSSHLFADVLNSLNSHNDELTNEQSLWVHCTSLQHLRVYSILVPKFIWKWA